MEVAMDLTSVLGASDASDFQIVQLYSLRIKQLQNPIFYDAIDKLCELSTKAMQLKSPLTSCDKLVQNPNQTLYLLWKKDESDKSLLIGLLKVGKKTLFLNDIEMNTYEGRVMSVLDFYVHFNHQRRSNGLRLFNYMLKSERIDASQLALDNPSMALLTFMNKHFHLKEPIWQNTNFVIFCEFFQAIEAKAVGNNPPEGWCCPSTPRHIGEGTTDTRWLGQASSGHESKKNAVNKSVHGDNTTDGTLGNRANQAKLRKAHILKSTPLW